MALNKILENVTGAEASNIILDNDTFNYSKLSDSLARIGVTISDTGINILNAYDGSDLDDFDLWGRGYLREGGSVAADGVNGDWRHSLAYLPISPGSYPVVLLRITGAASVVFYDKSFTPIGFFKNAAAQASFTGPLVVPAAAAYFRFSHAGYAPTEGLNIPAQTTAVSVSDSVFAKMKALNDMGVYSASDNLLREVAESSLDDEEIWASGFIHKTNGAVAPSTAWKHTVKYYDIPEGPIQVFVRISGNAGFAIYDKDKNVLLSVGANTTSSFQGLLEVPEGGKYIRVSHGEAYGSPEAIRVASGTVFYGSTSKTFIKTSEVFENVVPVLRKFGFEFYEKGHNFLKGLAESPLGEEDGEWIPDSYLSAAGQPVTGAGAVGWFTTSSFWPVIPGKMHLVNRFRGNAKAAFYDANKSQIQSLTNAASQDFFSQDITVPEGAAFFKTSFRGDEQQRAAISLYNIEDMFVAPGSGVAPAPDSVDLRNIFKMSNPAKRLPAMVTFIFDDGGHAKNAEDTEDWLLKAMRDLDIKGTFAIIEGRMGVNAGFWNREETRAAWAEGHEIANHTVSHDGNNQLNTLSEDQLEYQIGRAALKLRGLDSRIPVRVFVSPFGARTPLVDKVVMRYHEANFISGPDSNVADGTCTNVPPIMSYQIKRVSFDAGSTNWQGVSRLALCKQAVDVANTSGGWLVFAVHPHFGEYLEPNTVNRRQEFYDLVNYIKGLNIPILTASQALDFYKNPVQLGYISQGPPYYMMGANNIEFNTFF